MTQGDLASWIVAGSYKSIASAQPRLRARAVLQHAALRRRQRRGAGGHSRQRAQRRQRLRLRRVDGVAAVRARLRHRVRALRLSRRPGLWSPRFSVTMPLDGFRVKALASRSARRAWRRGVRALGHWPVAAAGADVLVAVADGTFHGRSRRAICRCRSSAILRRRHRVACADSISASTISWSRSSASVAGTYRSAARPLLRGNGRRRRRARLGRRHDAGSARLRARHHRIHRADRVLGSRVGHDRWRAPCGRSRCASAEKIHDLQTTIEATIPQTATRSTAKYRMNTAFWDGEPDAPSPTRTRASTCASISRCRSCVSRTPTGKCSSTSATCSGRRRRASIYDEALRHARPQTGRRRPAGQVLIQVLSCRTRIQLICGFISDPYGMDFSVLIGR